MVTGIFIVCISVVPEDGRNVRTLKVAAPCLIASGVLLIIAGVVYQFVFTRWRKERKRQQETVRLQELITSVVIRASNFSQRKYSSHGYTTCDNGGLIIGLNSLAAPDRSPGEKNSPSVSNRMVELPDAYMPGVYVDNIVDLDELRSAC